LPSTIAADQLGFFRWGRVAEKVLITTDGGDWVFLSEPEFAQLLAGEILEGHPRFAELQAGGFLRRASMSTPSRAGSRGACVTSRMGQNATSSR
jgi:hypothetical protein